MRKRKPIKPLEALSQIKEDTQIVCMQGSTRSGKSYGVCVKVVEWCLSLPSNRGFEISLIRRHLPSLKASIIKDIINVLSRARFDVEAIHSKAGQYFTVNNKIISYYATFSPKGRPPARVHGVSRDIAIIDEANEISFDEFIQVLNRTRGFIILIYNPDFPPSHWIRKHILKKESKYKTQVFKSTYKDNDFLTDEQVKAIEAMKTVNPYLWRVYGEGEFGTASNLVYPLYEEVESVPDIDNKTVFGVMGLDFGWVNETALIKCVFSGRDLYLIPLIYEKNLRVSGGDDSIAKRLERCFDGRCGRVADNSHQHIVNELNVLGYPFALADKSPGSKLQGIRLVQNFRLKLYTKVDKKLLLALKDELEGYQFDRDADGNVKEEPIKKQDHFLDAMRYATSFFCLHFNRTRE